MILFILYTLSSMGCGVFLLSRFFPLVQRPVLVLGGSLIGILLSVNMLYECLALGIVQVSALPLVYFLFSTLFLIVFLKHIDVVKRIIQTLHFSAFHFVLLAFFMSMAIWFITKSFRGDTATLLIGSNEVFDFGHSLSMIRSMSWGQNMPFLSPFVSGAVHIYYFMFYFWAALFERAGFHIVSAVNIPSIFSLSAFFIALYFFASRTFSSRLIGMITVLFTVFHSNLTFISYFLKKGLSATTFMGIWRNSTYLFNGPDDGSRITLGRTMNVFVNQRHFAFSLALVFCLFLLFEQKNSGKRQQLIQSCIAGIILGNLVLWHATLAFAGTLGLFLVFLFRKQYKESIIFVLSTGLCMFLSLLPWFTQLIHAVVPYIVSHI